MMRCRLVYDFFVGGIVESPAAVPPGGDFLRLFVVVFWRVVLLIEIIQSFVVLWIVFFFWFNKVAEIIS